MSGRESNWNFDVGCIELAAGLPHCWEVDSDSVPETWRIAACLAQYLQPGDVVGLDGELGAGKTHFVQGIMAALGVDPSLVTSPTFTLIQEYAASVPVCHLDAYRLRDIDEFLELGVDELLGGEVVCLIEWASRVAEALPQDRLQIELKVLSEQARRIRWTASGPRSQTLLEQVRSASTTHC